MLYALLSSLTYEHYKLVVFNICNVCTSQVGKYHSVISYCKGT